ADHWLNGGSWVSGRLCGILYIELLVYYGGFDMAPRRTSLVDRFWKNVRVGGADDCWPWRGAKNPGGYGHIIADGQFIDAHRAAYLLTKGPLLPGQVVRHTCDRRDCCNPRHLESGWPINNSQDMVERGRSNKGERHPGAKLTQAEVDELRRLYKTGDVTQRE